MELSTSLKEMILIKIKLLKRLYSMREIIIALEVFHQPEIEKKYLKKILKKTRFSNKDLIFKITMKSHSIKIKETRILTHFNIRKVLE
jgi:hypothetical protein